MEINNGYKVVLLGESGVGKTCIIEQFISGKYDDNTIATLTAQFYRKTFEFPGDKNITLDIWDTAGQEKFRALTRIFYKNAKAVILVYDITYNHSFNEIKHYWYEQIKQHCASDVIIAIAENKCDLYEKRDISEEEGEEFAKSIGAFFASTSAKNDSGITNLFENIAKKILEPDFDFYDEEQKIKDEYKKKKKKDNPRNLIKLNSKINKKKKKCC